MENYYIRQIGIDVVLGVIKLPWIVCLWNAVQSQTLILQMQGSIFTGEILAVLRNHYPVCAKLPVLPELSWRLNF